MFASILLTLFTSAVIAAPQAGLVQRDDANNVLKSGDNPYLPYYTDRDVDFCGFVVTQQDTLADTERPTTCKTSDANLSDFKTDKVVALPMSQMTDGSLCGKEVRITSAQATVTGIAVERAPQEKIGISYNFQKLLFPDCSKGSGGNVKWEVVDVDRSSELLSAL